MPKPTTEGTDELSISWKWLTGILTVIVVGLLSSWGATVVLRVGAMETANTVRGERVSVVEGRMAILEAQYRELSNNLKEFKSLLVDMHSQTERMRLDIAKHTGDGQRR